MYHEFLYHMHHRREPSRSVGITRRGRTRSTDSVDSVARTCIFCGNSAGSKEHVFPNWLNGVFPVDKTLPTPEWAVKVGKSDQPKQISRTWSASEIASVTSKLVCHECNTGWMANLENEARPSLIPLITGNSKELHPPEQLTIATWAVKTAMTIETTVPSDESDRFPNDQARIAMEQKRPPAHYRVFASALEGSSIPPMSYWVARAHIEGNGTPLGNIHVYTLQVGTLVLQVVRPEPPPENLSVLEKAAYPRRGESSLYPPVPKFSWPPEVTLNADTFVKYTSRGIDVPPEWQVPLPA